MKFTSIYQNLEQRITDTILSLWATGDPAFQKYLLEIFKHEKLMAEPIFQNMFPWEPSTKTFGELKGMFSPEFIKKLDSIKNEDYRFPSNRNPYLHQEKSWQSALKNNKSLLVTTGTGSGKTECFMIPVLQDIYENNPNSTGVNAIFLYPLNALIGSQKKRMHAWCKALGNIKYAVYNGSTKETSRNNDQNSAFPEVISREGIRKSPPQVLFTNPTMLEYMLVRDKDTELLRNSKGKLRWILLDEAHTLVGSRAAEMALLIRRVIEAFEVNLIDVRFAVTSATVGEKNDEAVIKFMADLCGISERQIELIKGKRVLPEMDDDTLRGQQLSPEIIHKIRDRIYKKPSINASEIGQIADLQSLHEQLEFMDKVSETEVNGVPSFPVRGHFFARNINGLYACTNPDCTIHPNKPKGIWGSITTITKKQCSCGFPLLELISCRSCGTYMLEGESQNEKVRLSSRAVQDLFQVNDEDNSLEETDSEEVEDQTLSSSDRIILQKFNKNTAGVNANNLLPIKIKEDGQIIQNPNHPKFAQIQNIEEGCPCCGESLAQPHHFRLSASFINRLVSDVILEQMDDMNPLSPNLVWNGRKYISFTDSRQGTAKISALINLDSEMYFLRSQIFHKLCEKLRQELPPKLSPLEEKDLQAQKVALEQALSLVPPLAQASLLREIRAIENKLNSDILPISASRKTWNELRDELEPLKDTQTLFSNTNRGNLDVDLSKFCHALLYTEFARRLPRERTLENLGMVNLVYPGLENIVLPNILIDYGLTRGEWHQLIKIGIDFVIRNRQHLFISPVLRSLSQKKMFSIPIYESEKKIKGRILKWPRFDRNNIRHSRLPLLICAGLGFHKNIGESEEETVNIILDELWKTIKSNFLEQDGTGENSGFMLNLERKAAFQLSDKLWLCPVKKRLIDTTFRGYSPWITGRLNAENLEKFKVAASLKFPIFPFPFNRDADNNHNSPNTIEWIQNDAQVAKLREAGMWNSLHERIINYKPLYLASEHSAQQSKERLETIENNFQVGKINILSCSTTMEMGVDIGGISAVVMSNVPPSPANYLQRTGRAGRRREKKSMALTICPSNPVGLSVMDNPSWALDHEISPPRLQFNSKTVVERHLNAFLFGKFVREKLEGMNVKEQISDFFFPSDQNPKTPAEQFEQYLTNLDSSLYSHGIKQISQNTPLESRKAVAIIRTVLERFLEIKDQVEGRVKDFDKTLVEFLKPERQGGRFRYTQNSPAYRAVNYQKVNFIKKNVLTYLSESGFLPAGGIPTGVVEFNTKFASDIRNTIDRHVSMPSYNLTRALAEYAPGMEVVIDGWTYTSGGIELQSNFGHQAVKSILQHCTRCGHEQILDGNLGLDPKCPVCEDNTLRGVSGGTFTEIIEPAGFAVDLFDNKKRQIKEASNAQYIEPLLINVQPWQESSHPVVEYRDSLPNAEIVYYNNGNGSGFSVCLDCGKASQNPATLVKHNRLRGGRTEEGSATCPGNQNSIRHNIMLVARFQTDFFEIRFRNENGSLIRNRRALYTLGHVLVKSLCAYLAIEEQEVDFGIKKYNGFDTIFLFDTARGGAGYVAQFGDHFEKICQNALEIVNRTCCDTACTKCLIDRKSQFYLDSLDKKEAKRFLERILERSTPPEIAAILPNNPQKIMGDVRSEIARYISKNQLTQLTIFVDTSIDQWETDQIMLFDVIASNKIPLQIVFRGAAPSLTNDQVISLIQLKAAFGIENFYVNQQNEINGLEQIARVRLNNGSTYDYFASQFVTALIPQWGSVLNDYTYRQDGRTDLVLSVVPLEISNLSNPVFDVFINSPSAYVDSNAIFDLFHQELKAEAQQKMKQWLEGKSIKVTYSDRYVTTPLGCLLLVQFLTKIRDTFQVTMDEVNIRLKEVNPSNYQAARYISNSFVNDPERTNCIQQLTTSCELSNVLVQLGTDLPHYRYFKLDIDGTQSIIIRPDAGIEHGWFAQNRYLNTEDLTGTKMLSIYQKVNKDLLYTISFEEKE